MTEMKNTLASFKDQNWTKVKLETKKVNKLQPNIPTCNITELYELIHARVKLVCDKNRFSSKEPQQKIQNLD